MYGYDANILAHIANSTFMAFMHAQSHALTLYTLTYSSKHDSED